MTKRCVYWLSYCRYSKQSGKKSNEKRKNGYVVGEEGELRECGSRWVAPGSLQEERESGLSGMAPVKLPTSR